MKAYNGVKEEKNEELFFPEYVVNPTRVNEDADFCYNQQYA